MGQLASKAIIAIKLYGIIKPGDSFQFLGETTDYYKVLSPSPNYKDWLIPKWVFHH